MQELQEFADDIASCPLADVQNLLSDDYTLQSRKCSLMKQMRRYKKHYIGIQIDDSFGLSTLPAVAFQLITTRTTFLRQPLVLILLQQRYHLTRLRFASQSATTTLLKEFTLRQRTRDLCNMFGGQNIDDNVMIYTIDLVPMRT